jgi:hypothetical protein
MGGMIFAGVGAGDYSGTLTIAASATFNVSTTLPGPPAVPGGFPAAFVLSPTMTILGGGTLSCSNTSGTVTFTSNGCTSVPNLNLRGAQTMLFTDTWTLNGSLSAGEASFSVTLTLGANIINVKGNLLINTTTGNISQTGTGGIILNGAGPQIWSQPNYNGGALRTNLTISNPNVVISGIVGYGVGTLTATTSAIATRSTLVLRSSCTLNTSLINWNNVNILGGATITMNDFFNGTPQVPTKVVSSNNVNYTINFTDGFEKLAKNVRVSRCTIGKRGQLLLLSKGGFGVNNLGIRYYNQLPNGVSTDTQKFVNNNLAGMPALRAVNMLVGDPVFT